MLELFVNNKKELQIEESQLFKSSKMLHVSFGTPRLGQWELYQNYMNILLIMKKAHWELLKNWKNQCIPNLQSIYK